ncbi:MAG: hypothetical protein RLZZ350_1068 [Verrucomicrobiota bacterium]|jgi:hypothetical protein
MQLTTQPRRRALGYSLPELLICLVVMMLAYGGTIVCYILVAKRATWSGYSLAAQALSIRQTEEALAAKWDTQAATNVDYVTNIPSMNTNILDLPYSGTNRSYATNFCTISTIMIQTNVGTQIHLIRVDTVWTWSGKTYTNSMQTYRAPN